METCKKHSPNAAKKFTNSKNMVQIITTMGTFVKTWLKWTNTGRFTLKWLLFAARLEISSKEYAEGPWGDNTPKVVDQLITTCGI